MQILKQNHTTNNYKLEVENTTVDDVPCYEITLINTDYNNVIFQGHVDTYNVAFLHKLIKICSSEYNLNNEILFN